jgi:hypothetical protein
VAAGITPCFASVAPRDADYIVVVADEIYCDAVDSLVQLRESDGFQVGIATLSEIRMSYPGLGDTLAMKSLISECYYTGERMPICVLFVGDAKRGDEGDLVPTHYEYSAWSGPRTAFEDWFVCVDEVDELPDIQLGRIPASSTEELCAFVEKLAVHQRSTPSAEWTNDVLILSYDLNMGNCPPGDVVHSLANQLEQNHMGPGHDITTMHRSEYDTDEGFTQAALDQFNLGKAMVGGLSITSSPSSYLGIFWHPHGFELDDLANTGEYPVVAAASCLLGKFDRFEPEGHMYAEDFLFKEDAGAIAWFAPTRSSEQYTNFAIESKFLEILSAPLKCTVGQAACESKLCAIDQKPEYADVVRSYALFGDPGTRMPRTDCEFEDSLSSSFEICDHHPFQTRLIECFGCKDPIARVYSQEASGDAVNGSRTLGVSLSDTMNSGGHAYFKLFDCEIELGEYTYLKYWVRADSASELSNVAVGGKTSCGEEIRDCGDGSIIDQFGNRLHPAFQNVGCGWTGIYARLSPLDGRELESISVGYQDPGASIGDCSIYVDCLYIGEPSYPADGENAVINGSFEEASRSQVVPDCWAGYGLGGGLRGSRYPRSAALPFHGGFSLALLDDQGEGGAASQALYLGDGYYSFAFHAAALDTATSIKVELEYAEGGFYLIDQTYPVGETWQENSCDFYVSVAGRYFLSFLTSPEDAGVLIDGVVIKRDVPVRTRPSGSPFTTVFDMSICPNPCYGKTEIWFEMPSAAGVSVDIFDVTGGLVRRLERTKADVEGLPHLIWDGTDSRGDAVASGVYFARASSAFGTAVKRIVVLR